MSIGGRTFRGFRPSHFGRQDDDLEEDAQQVKRAKIQLYAQRAQAGLPLFEPASVAKRFGAGPDFAVL